MKKTLKLKPRLAAAAEFVRPGAILADIGCDHGLLIAHLLLSGKIERAVASDVKEQPLAACKRLALECALSDKIDFVLANGLQSASFDSCTDIAVCGMGGELIAEILAGFKNIKSRGIHYIFNPMTHPEALRRFLCENSFEIGRDIIVKEGRHYYNVLEAEYTGKKQPFDEAYLYLGNINDFTHKEYFMHLIRYLEKKDAPGGRCSAVINAIKEKL
ncbi:MAG: class I SAM-dependent methyltransferase [Clostridiales bacterium]|nr:class I SAM-dependent methyltransferase [Clostridiales bacterium]